ncbi:Maltose/maltodextrin ABC transporter, substrate binding periplasmic protein MalE [Halanaerobium saccharolyticum subsp. saccharolyticum DSM 6643]|uniref:Maltose/maltodextrin ABC transporter, substrate binding periplasmic protein MalE n=1 Tax=Halanaerobium saccharolyticum subsp. saccharolyticum DSM 6643 TaxID=1293054 RepID=M5E2B2_9FIRM|nr:ABC transporter substrate-binding protein [Halanaerobium saccharolyticum]CCU80118.1 Maltose/maltodextrin ABC transporter, substrate binding periplasmic protein MalE [Halanaerobium saccharolyticum subsp. saccharolyticum DSM 6643]
MKRLIKISLFSLLIISLFSIPLLAQDQEIVTIAVGGNSVDSAKELANMYMEKNPETNVEILETPSSSTERLDLYLQFFEAKSSEVDVYTVDVVWPGILADHLIDFNDYGAEKIVDKHFDAIVENNTLDGRLIAMPWYTDGGLLYYRTDLLEEYGYDAPPKTWDKLEEMAATIQAGEREKGNQDFWGFLWQGNAYEGLTCDALEWVASHNGGQIVNSNKEITIYNDQAIKAIDRAASWVGEISPPSVTGLQEESSRHIWQNGNAAFIRNWPYIYSLGNSEDSAIKGKFDVSPLPGDEPGMSASTLGGWQLAVSKYSQNKEAAADVAMFMASEKAQKYRAIEESYNPTIKSLYEDEEVLAARPFFEDLYGVFMNAVPRPSTVTAPNYNEVSTSFFQSVHSVLNGEQEAAEALGNLQYEIQDITGFEIK